VVVFVSLIGWVGVMSVVCVLLMLVSSVCRLIMLLGLLLWLVLVFSDISVCSWCFCFFVSWFSLVFLLLILWFCCWMNVSICSIELWMLWVSCLCFIVVVLRVRVWCSVMWLEWNRLVL